MKDLIIDCCGRSTKTINILPVEDALLIEQLLISWLTYLKCLRDFKEDLSLETEPEVNCWPVVVLRESEGESETLKEVNRLSDGEDIRPVGPKDLEQRNLIGSDEAFRKFELLQPPSGVPSF